MSGRHFTVYELLHFIDDPSSVGDGEAILAHVDACPSCGRLYSEAKRIWEALEDPTTWIDAIGRPARIPDVPADPSQPSDRLVDSFMKVATQIADEDAEAPAVARELMSGAPSTWQGKLATSPLFVTGGVVRHLISRFKEEAYRDPLFAFEVASLARAVADALPAARYRREYRADLQAMARKHEANALRLLGRLPEALLKVEEADGILADIRTAEPTSSGLRMVRATILSGLERYQEAAEAAHSAASVLSSFGQKVEAGNASLLEGVIRYQMGQVRQAKEIFGNLIPIFREARELPSLAGVLSNLASCCADLGDTGAAAIHYAHAIPIFRDLGAKAEASRTSWSLGRMLVSTGKLEQGLPLLAESEAAFRDLGMHLDAGMVGLLLSEVFLELGRPVEAREVCYLLPETFRQAGLPAQAQAAVAYLAEATRKGNLSVPALRHVRSFLETAPRTPDLRFLPLPE